MLQEACINVIRHASASNASVVIAWNPDGCALEIEIEDDGKAIPESGTGGAGHGILNMISRTERLGGTLRAGPRSDGQGWRVSLRVPVSQ